MKSACLVKKKKKKSRRGFRLSTRKQTRLFAMNAEHFINIHPTLKKNKKQASINFAE